MKKPIVIIGKNGKTGSRVNRGLKTLGLATRAVSRSSTPAFDWEDSATWRPVLEGARAAYVTFQPDLAVPTAEQSISEFVQLAIELGVEHIVLLSGRGEAGAERAEKVLQQSGIEWNVIRASWFDQNFSEGFMIEGILSGELALPAADVLEPFIDIDDIAEVAVAVLTKSHLRNKLFEVTGPRALSFKQCVEEISQALGYPVKYTTIKIDEFVNTLRDLGEPKEMQWLMRELFTVVLDGRNSEVKTGVEEALGRPATDFSEYIQKVIVSGTWSRHSNQ